MSDESDSIEVFNEDIDEKKHEKIVEEVLNLNKTQSVKKPSRSEPTLYVSEFNLVKSLTGNKGSVDLNNLTKVLKVRRKHQEVSKKVLSISSKSQPLPTPLEKPQADLIRRSVNYEKSRLHLDRWEALVSSNRAAAHLSFPLNSVEKLKIEEKSSESYPSAWRLKSDLQVALEKLEPKVEENHIDTEDKNVFPLTLKELKEQRKEAAKLRAHHSYKEAKARRQNKIKSKKYHRILRREKIKQKLKEFEELQKTNPEEAMRKLEDIEKARAHERFSLRHKGTGQWAKSKQVRAKYDKESRQVLAQQLAISRELTQKLHSTSSDSEEEGIGLEDNSKPPTTSENNPWVNGINPNKDITDFISGYKKYWNEQSNKIDIKRNSNGSTDVDEAKENRNESKDVDDDKIKGKTVFNKKQIKSSEQELKNKESNKISIKLNEPKKKNKANLANSPGTTEWNVGLINGKNDDIEDIFDQLEVKLERKVKQKINKIINSKKIKKKKIMLKTKNKIDLTIPNQLKKQVIDEDMIEQPKNKVENNERLDEISNSGLDKLKQVLNSTELIKEIPNINPDKFIEAKKTNLNTADPDILMTDENEENSTQRDIILEAFEDDDIAEDFKKEKAEEVKKGTPKDIDLNLPGWGSWGGTNINPNRRKRRRFIIKMPKKIPRRDDNKGSLIINEKAQSKIKSHMVSEVPFPFTSVKDYEASIRAPIGNNFVPETAFKQLIQPAVITKIGTVIEPISKSVLIGKKNE